MVSNRYFKHLRTTTLLFVMWAAQLAAQPQFIAKADRYTIGKHEDFTVTFTINEQASGFEAPAFAHFTVLQGPSRSQSTIMRNFQTEFNLTFTYVLRAKKVGTYTIEPAKIKIGKEVFETKPLEIKVVESSPKSDNPNDPTNMAKSAAFGRIRVSKRNVYIGEPFVATYQVVTRVNVGQPTILENPQYAGAYKAELKIDPNEKPATEVIDGTPYNVFNIRQDLIVPQKAGSFAPRALVMELPTQLPTNQYDFFGRQYVQTVKQISEANFPVVTVKALPAANKPADFSGAVGQYKLDVQLSRTSVKANESVSLNIQISGLGNVKLVEVPTPELPSALEAFDPKISDKVRETAKGMEGSKAFEYLLIPRYKGVYKIPPVRFSFFDPVAERYQILESAEMQIEVTDGPAAAAGTPGAGNAVVGQDKERVEFIGKDILFIKTQPGTLQVAGTPLLLQPYFKMLLALPFVAMVLGLLAHLFLNRRNKDTAAVAGRAASKAVKQRLAAAQQALTNNQVRPFYEALSHALWDFFEVRLQLPKSQHTQSAVLEKLEVLQVPLAEREQLRSLLNRCEQAQYGMGAASNMSADYNLATTIITKLLK
jgi:hypothetical protein